MTKAAMSWCGTGGCAYEAYTVDADTGRLVPVPFMPWANPRYMYNPKRGRWVMRPAPTREAAVQLGFGGLTATGFSESLRTYNAINGIATVADEYATLPGSAAGEWCHTGPVRFNPSSPFVGYQDVSSAASAVSMYLQAVLQGQPGMAAPFVEPGAKAAAFWRTLRPLERLGFGGTVDQAMLRQRGNVVTVPVTGASGSGVDTTLAAWTARASVTTVGGYARLRNLTLTALPVTVRTVPDVLRRLQADPRIARWLAAHPAVSLSITPWNVGWSVAPANQGSGVTINAETGAVTGSL